MADASDFKPILSSSRLFTYVKGESKADGKLDDKWYNYMTSSYDSNDFLEDSEVFGLTAPLIYQLDLLKDDVDSIHTHLSESRYTDKVASFGEVKIQHGLYVEKTSEFNGNIIGKPTFTGPITASNDISSSGTITMLTASIGGGIFTSASLAAGGGGSNITVDTSITNGSTNPVTNDAIFDALALKATIGGVKGDLLPNTDGNFDLGSSTKEWQDLHIDGTANIDRLDVDAVGTNILPLVGAKKGLGQTLGNDKFRWGKLYLASTINVSGSELVIASPSASAAGDEFNVVISGSLIPGDLATGSIGTLEKPFKDLYVQSSSLYFADMSDHGGKSWKQMSKSEKLARSTIFQKNDIDKLKRGESLNDSGHISASGNLHIVGTTTLKGETDIEGETTLKGNTTIEGFTDIRGQFRVNGSQVTNLREAINYAESLRGTGVTTAEFDKLDGLTSTAAELNILDGVTSTTAELNTLDGFTGDKDDLIYAKDLKATGVTTTEFNTLDGVGSTALSTQLAAKLPLTGGTMTGLVAHPYVSLNAEKLAEAKGVIDARAISMINIETMKNSKGFQLIQCRPKHVGQELTIIINDSGTIKHTDGDSKDEGVFVMANGKDISAVKNTAYKFVCSRRLKWIQLTYI